MPMSHDMKQETVKEIQEVEEDSIVATNPWKCNDEKMYMSV